MTSPYLDRALRSLGTARAHARPRPPTTPAQLDQEITAMTDAPKPVGGTVTLSNNWEWGTGHSPVAATSPDALLSRTAHTRTYMLAYDLAALQTYGISIAGARAGEDLYAPLGRMKAALRQVEGALRRLEDQLVADGHDLTQFRFYADHPDRFTMGPFDETRDDR